MKYYELGNVVLLLLLFGGMYLPYVRKVVKNKLVMGIFLVLSVIPVVGTPMYSVSVITPQLFRDSPLKAKLFNIQTVMSCWSVVFKIFHFYYKQKSFEELIHIWDEISDEVLYPKLRQEILLKAKRATDRWAIGFAILFSASVTLFCIAPFYSKKLEHPSAFTLSGDSLEFRILVTYELIVTFYLCMAVHSYNSFLMQNVAFVKGSCEYLRKSLGIIFDSLRVGVSGEIDIRRRNPYSEAKGAEAVRKVSSYGEATYQAEADLRRWIRDHQNVIKFHNELQEIFHVPLSMEFAVLVLLICIIAFMIITNSIGAVAVFVLVAYCATTYTIFYVSCFYGDLTGIETTSLHQDAFGNGWHLYPTRLQKNFHIIILRCSKPMYLSAFKIYPLNSGSFAKIFRHSYSFFMFLLQVINKTNTEDAG